MPFAKIENNAVVTYPYTLRLFKVDNPNTSFPKNPSPELLAEWGVHTVFAVQQPRHLALGQ